MSDVPGLPRHPRARVVVFAREPELGRVKSRLAGELGERAALAVYEAMLQRVGRLLAQCRLAPWDLWITSNPSHERFLSICNKKNIYIQKGNDLGERMDFAIAESLRRHDTDAVILIGTDCPALTEEYLEQAILALETGSEVVLGPAEDGGYVLIGARQAIPAVFAGIPWGSDKVLSLTLERLEGSGLTYRQLDTLWDVDNPDDIARLDSLSPPLIWESRG